MEERTFEDAHGVEVFTRWWPVASPKGAVLVSHGASEHSGRYDRFAGALNAAGHAVVAVDHRGHGRTGSGGRATMGVGGGAAVVDDLHELRALAASAFGDGVPTFLFGHSMGSLIGLAYLTAHSEGLAGAVLCGFPADLSTTGSLADLLRGAVDGGMADEPFDAMSGYNEPFQPARTNFDWLSRDPDEVDEYVADPLCGDDNPLTYGYVLGLFDVVSPAADRLSSIQCPVFVIAGDQDPAGGMGEFPSKLAEAMRAAGRTVDVRIYEGARHELLNETNRDDVTADVVDWFDRRVSD